MRSSSILRSRFSLLNSPSHSAGAWAPFWKRPPIHLEPAYCTGCLMRVRRVYPVVFAWINSGSDKNAEHNRPTNKANYYRFTQPETGPQAYSVYIIIYYLGNFSKSKSLSQYGGSGWLAGLGECLWHSYKLRVALLLRSSCRGGVRRENAALSLSEFSSGSKAALLKAVKSWGVCFLSLLTSMLSPRPLPHFPENASSSPILLKMKWIWRVAHGPCSKATLELYPRACFSPRGAHP